MTNQFDSQTSFIEFTQTRTSFAYVPLFLGVWTDVLLLGILMAQGVYWYTHFRREDGRWIKMLVIYLASVACLHTVLVLTYGLFIFAINFGNFELLDNAKWFMGVMAFGIAITVPVEIYYAHRAYILWEKKRLIFIVPAALVIWLLVSFGFFLAHCGDPVRDVLANRDSVIFLWALVLLDWTLSAIIIFGLYRSRQGLLGTDKVVLKVMMLTAEAQLVPSLLALALLIKTAIGNRNTVTLIAVGGPKIWAISCMAVINSRRTLRQGFENERARRENTFFSENGLADLQVTENKDAGEVNKTTVERLGGQGRGGKDIEVMKDTDEDIELGSMKTSQGTSTDVDQNYESTTELVTPSGIQFSSLQFHSNRLKDF